MAASVERWRRPDIVRRIERVRRTGFIQPVNQALPSAAFQRDKRGEEGSDYVSPASMSPAPGSLSRCGEAPLVPSAVPAESTPPDLGAIQRVAGTLPIAFDPHYSPARGFLGPRWVTFRRSRVRESRTLGSVGAKAEWLSYPTIPC